MRKVVYVLLLQMLVGCGPRQIPDLLTEHINAELAKHNGTIDISKFDKVKWDKLYVVGAYQNDRSFDEALLEYENEIEATGISYDEGFQIILLFDDDELVSLTKVNYWQVDFGGAYKADKNYKNTPYAKKNAVFRYQTGLDGNRYIPTGKERIKPSK